MTKCLITHHSIDMAEISIRLFLLWHLKYWRQVQYFKLESFDLFFFFSKILVIVEEQSLLKSSENGKKKRKREKKSYDSQGKISHSNTCNR